MLELLEHLGGLHALGDGGDPAARGPTLAMASTMLRSTGSVATWAMNWPSIFRKSTGRVFRYMNEDSAAAEVVEREPAAARLQLAHEVDGVREVGDRRGLGDLEAHGAGDQRVRQRCASTKSTKVLRR